MPRNTVQALTRSAIVDISNDTSTTGVLSMNSSVTSTIDTANDQDWFRVELVAGTTYEINLEGDSTNSGTLFDTYFRGIYNSNGDLISDTTNDDDGVFLNSQVRFTAIDSGVYYLSAGAYDYDIGTYTLSIDVSSDGGTPAPNDISNDSSTTGVLSINSSVTSTIDTANDQDWFRVELVAGTTYEINLEGDSTNSGTLFDTYFRGIYNSNGDLISDTTNDDGGAFLNSQVRFTAIDSGVYYLSAGAYEDNTGTYEDNTGTYTLSINTSNGDTPPPPTTPTPGDISNNTNTTGVLSINNSVTSTIDTINDQDWFRVELVADTTYEINLEGAPTNSGTLSDTYFRGIYNSNGDFIDGTANDDSGTTYNSQVRFAAVDSGVYYLSAGAYGDNTGTYTLSINTSIGIPTLSLANDTGLSSTDNITNDATVNVSGLVNNLTSWEYSTNNGSTWVIGSGTSFELSENTTYTADSIQVRQTDTAGNVSRVNKIDTIVVIDTSVSIPTLSLANDTGLSSTDNITNDATVNVSGLDNNIASWTYSMNNGTTWVIGSGTSFELSENTTYATDSIQIRQTDAAGNVSEVGKNASEITIVSSTTPVESNAWQISSPPTGQIGFKAGDEMLITITMSDALTLGETTGSKIIIANKEFALDKDASISAGNTKLVFKRIFKFSDNIDSVDFDIDNPETDIALHNVVDSLGNAPVFSSTAVELGDNGNNFVASKYTGAGQTIVVIDTGISTDYTNTNVIYSYDFSGNNDDNARNTTKHHGGMVAHVAQQFASGVKIIHLKISADGSDRASDSAIEEALQWVVNNADNENYNITAVNLSFGGGNVQTPTSWEGSDEYASLDEKGIIVAVASGNDKTIYNTDGVNYLSSDTSVISVSAVDLNGNFAWFSQQHKDLTDVAALGQDVEVTNNDGIVRSIDGTSFSAPTIAAAAALVQEAAEALLGHRITDEEFIDLIQKTGDRVTGYTISGNNNASTSNEIGTSLHTQDDISYPQSRAQGSTDNTGNIELTLNDLVRTADDVMLTPQTTTNTAPLSEPASTEHPVGYTSLNIDNALQYLTENQGEYNDLILA